ncbi:hypothetical protein B5F76_14215 [Desulfovibrio sp. An276]|uniref:nucleotide-binding domain-containing protein n=1 Tax=Desulfovibrio sp. An276 TaxID=1965618 RepID=UPI000B38C4A4|nr:nucleotidyltransferase [Desulfovibrio sp. An276]OUO49246.1 hypothetical protein B5F76_14215 [Desulfovibrio sp. An276]
MLLPDAFKAFKEKLSINTELRQSISKKYCGITEALNDSFRCISSSTAYSLQVGSFGRHTAIKSISDLDMVYILPDELRSEYKDSPEKILYKTRDILVKKYPKTNIRSDRLVVCVHFLKCYVEVQPVFEIYDKNDSLSYFEYPDTYKQSWKKTKPRHEIHACKYKNDETCGNYYNICKMIRAWKNNFGIKIGGLLIDTLVYNFFSQDTFKEKYCTCSFDIYDQLLKDFFFYLKNQSNNSYYHAPGSNQQVRIKEKFIKKAEEAYNIIDTDKNCWKKIFGRYFPQMESLFCSSVHYRDTEEFIEDYYPVEIKGEVSITAVVSANGFRPRTYTKSASISSVYKKVKASITFSISTNINHPYTVKWKILNRGDEAKARDCIRGQIITSGAERKEPLTFLGNHYVECYIIQDEIVIARDRFYVNIEENLDK